MGAVMLWTFENYRLDTDNAVLWKDGEQVALRPKTFDLLCYLVEHAGELVRKDTLLEAVWTDRYVVEGVLTTSMSELRKLFGDTAREQRFIATVYRRGYRFIAPVEQVGAAAPPAQGDANAPGMRQQELVTRFPRMRHFVGRKAECEQLLQRLVNDADCRILSLVGPGGIGKTRLALTVLEQIAQLDGQPFVDGLYAVALQSPERDDDLYAALANSLELTWSGDLPLAQHVRNYLHNKQLLLLLDNFEHLLEQGPALLELVESAPGLKILLTTRESLPLREAWFHPVAGLEYGDALRLFAQVAKRNQPDFDVQESMPEVMRICRMVECMPLALELAANWLKVLTIGEVADEIEKGIDILSAHDAGDDERHASMRAIFNETWQRLTGSERSLLRRFSLFRGGADRAAIGEIIGAGLPLLATLVNKALLRSDRQSRYRMHELIRQFAEEQLAADADEEHAARQACARYYLTWLGQQQQRLRGERQGDACRDIQADIDNIRRAWRWAVEDGQAGLLRDALRPMSLFADLRGHFQVGLTMFASAREMIAAGDDPERDRLLAMLDLRSAILNFRLSRYDAALELFHAVAADASGYERALCLRFLGDYHFSHAGYCSAQQARRYLDECAGLSRELDDIHLQTECLVELAILHANLDIDIEASQAHAQQAVELARRTRRPDLLASALDVLAWTANHRGDYAAAEATWREVFEIAWQSGNRVNEALATNWLGWSAWSVGGARHAEAAQLFSDALLRYRNLGDRANQAMSCADLASVQLELGELDSAEQHCRRGLELAREIGREDHYVYNLYTLGAVQCARGDLVAARDSLASALELAWRQEEQTNKPVVVYYVARLLYAEHRADGDAGKLALALRLLRFLQCFPPTWQTYRDRAARLQRHIEEESGQALAAPWSDMPAADLVQAVLPDIPGLLSANAGD